jgi:hypothetical protein
MRAGVLGEGKKVMGKGVSQREEVSYGGQRRDMDKYAAVEVGSEIQ